MSVHSLQSAIDSVATAEPRVAAPQPSDLANEIQALVDVIAIDISRSVLVETLEHSLVAYNCDAGTLDDAQTATILHRAVPATLQRHLPYADFTASEKPTRVPAADRFGLQSRLCITLRHHRDPVGYLWIADPDETLRSDAIADILPSAEGIGARLHQANVHRRDAWHRRRDALRAYVGELPEPSLAKIRALSYHGVALDHAPLSCLVLGPSGASHPTAQDFEALCVRERLRGATATIGSAYVFVTVAGHNALDPARLRRVGHAMRDMLAAGRRSRTVAGLSSTDAVGAAEVAAVVRRAMWACRVALALPEFDTVTSWEDLGIYRVVEGASQAQPADVLPPALWDLLDNPAHSDLAGTLERYLDCGGDVKLTAAELSLHRTSLYYRLQRIEEMTGMSLRDGGERLALHFGLKIARVLGSYPSGAVRSNAA
jgi:PucR C-terminal helix-turn-helix domain